MTDDEQSPAQRRRLEIANRAIRMAGMYAREAPRIVAEELGLVAKLTVSKDIYAEMQLPRDYGVRLRIHQDRLALAGPRYRRWWQFWKPKVWMEVVAEKPYATKVGDTIQLMQQMWSYVVTVNDDEVLRYPPT